MSAATGCTRGLAATCPNANAAVGQAPAQALRSAVVCLINQARAAHHLPTLHESVLLDRSAQRWTSSMVASDEFSHGTNFASRITAAGYVWRAAGENIATGFATPRSVVRAWMASTGHCQNILNPQYRNVGTGVSPRAVRGFATGVGDLDAGLRARDALLATVGQLRPDGRLPVLSRRLGFYAEARAAAPSAPAASVSGNGVSRRYHSASSAA